MLSLKTISVQTSICGLNRAVILMGKHTHINGFRMNGNWFDGDQSTFPKMVQEVGCYAVINLPEVLQDPLGAYEFPETKGKIFKKIERFWKK